ncbi:hemerythrin domain-containing protein [Actinomycetospora endophytica]|uniref:Hemerythrin domain-containing protein n=1 Tax=Actinomycetospora endophytica TaxID=2291215 RepID=A0ABS8P783_9PSEU|nr:hemerythrin domain-containing protein [Actinomycetospora endophytica]MCD2194114.1 hemerythrin domain-containing protein [Actinomycetospora endophytica]
MTATTASAPTRDADLLGIRIAHRIMRRDARRLAELATAWADGSDPLTGRRRRVFGRWIEGLCRDIHHHHATEDDHLWPILERRAGAEIDLAPLSDDHAALDPVLDDVRGAFVVAAADGRVDPLAERLTFLADLLDEHISEEERDMFPVILGYVPLAEWSTVEKAAQRGGPGIRYALPRIVDVATPQELARMTADAPAVLVLLMKALLPRYRHEKRLLGASGPGRP